MHDLSNVLDPKYVPNTAEEFELFELQKQFIYSVFLSKVTVADGINIENQQGCPVVLFGARHQI